MKRLAPSSPEMPDSKPGRRGFLQLATLAPALIVLAAGGVAALLLLQERQEFSELRASLQEENRLRAQSSLGHVEEYFDAVYSALLFISVDDDVMALRRDSRHYIEKLFDRQWQQHRLAEVYVVERDFTGERPPFMTFERATGGLLVKDEHSLSREEDEYRVQMRHMQRFATNQTLPAQLSEETSLCTLDPTGERSRGYVYSVPIRTNQGLAGLVAGMIQKSTVAEILRQGLKQQVALLVSERGDLILPEGIDPGIEEWFRQRIDARGASDFFAGAAENFPVQQWHAHWSPAKIVAAQKWWLVYLHPETDFQPQTLLAGTFGHLILAGSLVGLGIALALLVRSLSKRLDQHARHLRERRRLEREVQEVSEREQRRIGTGLQEDLCQRLTGIEAASRVLERRLEAASNPEAPIAAEITREIRTTLHSARQMADELQPVGLLEHGFVAALDELARHTRQRAGITCTVQDQGFPGNLDTFVATHLFRIAQEAVANSLEHARADTIHITLGVEDGHLSLTLSDNGVGIPEGAEAGPGIGLRIMRYQADLIGAQLEVRRAGQRGTEIYARFPYPAPGAETAADSINGGSI